MYMTFSVKNTLSHTRAHTQVTAGALKVEERGLEGIYCNLYFKENKK